MSPRTRQIDHLMAKVATVIDGVGLFDDPEEDSAEVRAVARLAIKAAKALTERLEQLRKIEKARP